MEIMLDIDYRYCLSREACGQPIPKGLPCSMHICMSYRVQTIIPCISTQGVHMTHMDEDYQEDQNENTLDIPIGQGCACGYCTEWGYFLCGSCGRRCCYIHTPGRIEGKILCSFCMERARALKYRNERRRKFVLGL